MTPIVKFGSFIRNRRVKLSILALVTGLTIAIHYGWLTQWAFGHVHWIHALHSRFCYVPIVIAASWFGLRGGIYCASAISLLILPYVFDANPDVHNLSMELVEIFFYYGIGILVGALVDRETRVRKQHETTLLQLERSQRLSLVGQMAAGVAHEIKNPLTSIKGVLEIVSDEKVAKSDRDEFRDIGFREVRRIDSTIAEFLEFARPKEMKRDALDFSAALTSSLKQLQPQVAKAGMTLHTQIDPGIHVLGDQEKLHQVILNILLNAIDASDSGDRIDVQLAHDLSDQPILTISDSGKGMTQNEIEQAFDPFFTTKSSGTGLGLSIVKSIVENHGGQIHISSTVNKGTQVTIWLPPLRVEVCQ